MVRINISTHTPKTIEKLNEIVELSDGAIVHAEGYPTSLFIELVHEEDFDIIVGMIKESKLTIL
jgi:hypothetical protein